MATNSGWFFWVIGVLMLNAPGMSHAEDGSPLSAIDWLSNSLDVPEDHTPALPDLPLATAPPAIVVLPLDAPTPDAAGLRPASDFGLAPRLWGRSAAADLAALLVDLPDGSEAPPSINRFLSAFLTLEFDPPIDAAIDDSFFLARVDRLLSMGQLDLAKALISKAGPVEAERFRRAFDIALLQGSESEACRIIEDSPELSPTYPARIFCLARLGNWDVAALTLGNAEALGILSDEEDQLMRHFLEPEISESEPLPTPPPLPTPLMFRLYEAVGERIPTDQLPVAYAFSDLSTRVGWQARLRAVERLVATDALPFDRLIEVFEERKPAASGGVFDRVAAFQTFKAALDNGALKTVNETLSAAWIAAQRGGYESAFAEWSILQLTSLDLDETARHQAFEMALLAGLPDAAAGFADDTPEDRFLLAIASGQGGAIPGSSLLNQAVVRGLAALSPGVSYDALIHDDRRGEALLRALQHLNRGAGGNPQSAQDALTLLRVLGLNDLARQVAVELVLMDGAA